MTGKKAAAAARKAGLRAASIPTLLVAGDNRRGLGHAIAQAIAEAGINIDFFVAQVVGGKFSAVVGFDNQAGADKAVALIKKAARKPAK